MLGVRKAHQSTWFLNESQLRRINNLFCSESTEKYCSNLQEYFIPLLSLHCQKPRHSYSTQSEFEFIIKHFACMSHSIYHKTHINMNFLLQNNNWILVSEKKKRIRIFFLRNQFMDLFCWLAPSVVTRKKSYKIPAAIIR
jgi:hypothetical protein